MGLEPFKKFVVGGSWVGGGGWLRGILVLSLSLKLNNLSSKKKYVPLQLNTFFWDPSNVHLSPNKTPPLF